jgi:hypothetical protein
MFQEGIDKLVVISKSRWSLFFCMGGRDAFLFQEREAKPWDIGDDGQYK